MSTEQPNAFQEYKYRKVLFKVRCFRDISSLHLNMFLKVPSSQKAKQTKKTANHKMLFCTKLKSQIYSFMCIFFKALLFFFQFG